MIREARGGGIGGVVAVAIGEARRLARDRKAIVLAVLLPILAYPALILGSARFGEIGERQLAEREIRLAMDLAALDPGLARAVRERLATVVERAVIEETDLSDWHRNPPELRESSPWSAVILTKREAEDGPVHLTVMFHGADEDGIAASSQVLRPLRDLAAELESDAFRERFGSDPAERFRVETRDVARAEDSRGMALGRFLPLVAVLVLLSGGAFAALDAFAGEREQGTLETLLVQPLPASTFAYGKFLVVLAAALVAWIGNVSSLIFTVESGFLPTAMAGLPDGGRLGVGRILVAGALFLPTVVLLSAVLCLIAARARSFREGQHYLMPATLIGAALAAPALAPDVRLDPLLALLPLTGPSLALRDTLAGELAILPGALAAVSSLFFAALALSRLTATLDAERLLAAPPPKSADPGHHVAVRSTRTAFAALALVYVVGGWLQSKDFVFGVVATLFGLVLGLALWLAARNARDRHSTVAMELALRAPGHGATRTLVGVVAALVAGPGLAWIARRALEQQGRVLPLPPGPGGEVERALLELPVGTLLFVIAVAPGICEELLFRGALLRGWLARRGASVVRALFVQAFFFAAVHASVHRLPLTFALGVILGALTLRARLIWPAIALHASYNASQVLSELRPGFGLDHAVWLLGLAPLAAWASLSRGRPAVSSPLV